MSRRIDCTLTEPQWGQLRSALAYYECHLQDNLDGGEGGAGGTALAVLDRLRDKVAGWSA